MATAQKRKIFQKRKDTATPLFTGVAVSNETYFIILSTLQRTRYRDKVALLHGSATVAVAIVADVFWGADNSDILIDAEFIDDILVQ